MRPTTLALALLALTPLAARAQARWKEIGKTSSGNSVYVDARSVKREKGIVHATLRVKFTPPVKTATGTMTSSRTVAMFDCARQSIAAKENVYYDGERVAQRTVNKMPGFGPALKGSMGSVALDYLCR